MTKGMTMSTQTAHAVPRPRRWGRSIGAVFAGILAIFVLSLGTDQIFHALGVYPGWGQPMRDTGLLVLAFGYRLVYDVFGCYLTARLAPYAPMGHALALGVIGTILSTLGAIEMWNFGPNWYPVALAASALPSAWLGGMLHRLSQPR
jgi:hypothetical protein